MGVRVQPPPTSGTGGRTGVRNAHQFRRASTDVASRITKKLVEDYERARKLK